MIGLLEVLVITLLGILVVTTVGNIIDAKYQIDQMKKDKVEFCSRHEWGLDHKGYMICNVCSYRVEN